MLKRDDKFSLKTFSILALTITCLVGGGCASLEKQLGGKPFTATFKAGESIVAQFTIGKADDAVGVAANTQNEEPQGPAAIATSPEENVFVLDTLNQRIVEVQPDESQTRSIVDIPQAQYGVDLVVTDDFFYVLDSQGHQVLKLDRDGKLVATYAVDPSVNLDGSVTLTVLPGDDIRIRKHGAEEIQVGPNRSRGELNPSELATATDQGPIQSRFARSADNDARLVLKSSTRDVNAPAELKVESKEFLASVELLSVDDQGRYYVLAEELPSKGSEMTVHTAVVRYTKEGKLDGIADLPLQDTVFVPNRFVTVTPDGKVYFLQPGEEDVKVVEVPFEKRDSLSLAPEQKEPMTRDLAPAPKEDSFEETVRGLNVSDHLPASRSLGITRRQIIANAESYLNVRWQLNSANYQQGADQGQCSPPASLWKRPVRLNGMEGREIRAVPYKWGGYQSLAQFQKYLSEGYLAGDVCTCRTNQYGYCITNNSTGVDCSGFVSRVLEENYYTTSNLKKIADPLPSFLDLRPGDILNRAGHHVRLFVGFAEDGPLALKTIESAVSCGGVCAATYRVSQLRKYVPMRYRKVQE